MDFHALVLALGAYGEGHHLGELFDAPYDVVLSPRDVAQPGVLVVSNERAHIVTVANAKGAPDFGD